MKKRCPASTAYVGTRRRFASCTIFRRPFSIVTSRLSLQKEPLITAAYAAPPGPRLDVRRIPLAGTNWPTMLDEPSLSFEKVGSSITMSDSSTTTPQSPHTVNPVSFTRFSLPHLAHLRPISTGCCWRVCGSLIPN